MEAGARVQGPSGLPDLIAVDKALGQPGSGAYTVQVVGTNGKGSTSSMLAHALIERGVRVGLFTSPHIYRVNERIRVNHACIEDAPLFNLCEAVAQKEASLGVSLTFFELLTMLALLFFEQQGVDVILLEAGLGGRLDSTRVRTPALNLFTPIDLDHQAILGPTIEDIAKEKAAVIHQGAPALCAVQDPRAMACLKAQAHREKTSLVEVLPLPVAHPTLPGVFQRQNASLALAAAKVVLSALGQQDIELSPAILEGWSWPGRLEICPDPRGGGVVWDVAHNPHAVAAVLDSLSGQRFSLDAVYWFSPVDKDRATILSFLARIGCQLYEVALDETSATAKMSVRGAREAIEQAQNNGQWVLVLGSHRLIAALRPGPPQDQLLDPVPRPPFSPN